MLDLGMYSFFKKKAQGYFERDIVSFFGSKIKCSRLCSLIERHSGYLRAKGFKKGDVAALCLPNIPSALVAFYALNSIGVTVSVVHPLMPPQGLLQNLKATNAKVVYIMDRLYLQYKDILKNSGIEVITCSAGDCLDGFVGGVIRVFAKGRVDKKIVSLFKKCFDKAVYTERDSLPNAVYMHSAGTTGEAKTVVLSDYALNNLTQNMLEVIEADANDTVKNGDSMLMILPMFHIFGLGVCMHTALCIGLRAVMLPFFKAKIANAVLRREKINYVSGIPSMYAKMLHGSGFRGKHLKHLKYCFVGGDTLAKSTKEQFDAVVASCGGKAVLSEGYGLSEATVCSVNTALYHKKASLGRAKGDNKFCIIDEDKTKLKAGEIGEICVSSKSLMTAYLNDKATTQKVLFRDEQDVLWLKTGDIGYLDDEDFLFFKGRIKRLIKISGINVFPKEIEDTAMLTGRLAECCAVEAHKGSKRIIRLFAVLNEQLKAAADQAKDGGTLLKDIHKAVITEIKIRLLKYNLPAEVVFIDSLPKNQVQKVDYKALQAQD